MSSFFSGFLKLNSQVHIRCKIETNLQIADVAVALVDAIPATLDVTNAKSYLCEILKKKIVYNFGKNDPFLKNIILNNY